MKSYLITLEQIKAIYEAGMRRGEDEASSYEWGSRASGNKFDELRDVLHDDLDFTWKEAEEIVKELN